MNGTSDRIEENVARTRAQQLHGFQTHLLTYIVVILGLLFINLATPGGVWFDWPALIWGAALLTHALTVYALRGPS